MDLFSVNIFQNNKQVIVDKDNYSEIIHVLKGEINKYEDSFGDLCFFIATIYELQAGDLIYWYDNKENSKADWAINTFYNCGELDECPFTIGYINEQKLLEDNGEQIAIWNGCDTSYKQEFTIEKIEVNEFDTLLPDILPKINSDDFVNEFLHDLGRIDNKRRFFENFRKYLKYYREEKIEEKEEE